MTTTATPEPTTRVRELSRSECVDALRSHSLGRVALSVDALPVILPVNYIFDGSGAVFRTRSGSVLDRNCRNTVVAFEVDEFNPATRVGWSVLVVGVASALFGGDWLRALELGLSSVGAPDGAIFVKIVPGSVTGRAIEAAPASTAVAR